MNKFYWVSAYTLLVLVFTVIYTVIWIRSPDSFIINEDLNMSPFVEARNVLWGDGNYQVNSVTTLYGLKQELDSLYLKKSKQEKKSMTADQQLKDLSPHEKSAFDQMAKEREINIEKYIDDNLSQYRKISEEFISEIKKQESHLNRVEDAFKRLPLISKVGAKRIEYADFKILFAQKKYEVHSYVLSNFGSFASKEIINKVMELQDNRIDYLKEGAGLQRELRNIRGKISEIIKFHYEQRKSRLGAIDFLYFSIGISTTTTFGDIVANSKVARAFVVLQLILSVVVVGGCLNSLAKKK